MKSDPVNGKYDHFMTRLKLNHIIALILILSRIEYAGGQPFQDSLYKNLRESVEHLPVDERVLLKTDRQRYLCGENIYFTGFTFDGNWFLPVSVSSVLYVELYSQDLKVISKGKFCIRNGKCCGKLGIPRLISTDIYLLRAYTRYMQNFGESRFFMKRLGIVNPFYDYNPDTAAISLNDSFEIQDNTSTILQSGNILPGKAKITLTTARANFDNREPVSVVIHSEDSEGKPVKTELSLFVTLSDGRAEDEIIFQSPASRDSSALKYLPETRGDIISGRVLYSDKQPAASIELLCSVIGGSASVESWVTGRDGSFMFLAGNGINTGDLILKTVKPERETIILLDDEFYPLFAPVRREILQLNDSDIDLIRKQFINIQVDDAFNAGSMPEEAEIDPDTPAFYGDAYTEYRFSDYAKLPNMREFIFEIIEGVVSVRENKKEVIRILDKKSFNSIGPDPLILIDGVPVSEASAVMKLDPGKVQYVRVVGNKYFYKKKSFDGILDIITYSGDASAFDFPEGTFRFDFMPADRSRAVTAPLPPDDGPGNIPVYRNMLFSQPMFTTDDNGNAEISFITPDNSGTFLIQCFGLTSDGIAIEGKTFITVGEKQME